VCFVGRRLYVFFLTCVCLKAGRSNTLCECARTRSISLSVSQPFSHSVDVLLLFSQWQRILHHHLVSSLPVTSTHIYLTRPSEHSSYTYRLVLVWHVLDDSVRKVNSLWPPSRCRCHGLHNLFCHPGRKSLHTHIVHINKISRALCLYQTSTGFASMPKATSSSLQQRSDVDTQGTHCVILNIPHKRSAAADGIITECF